VHSSGREFHFTSLRVFAHRGKRHGAAYGRTKASVVKTEDATKRYIFFGSNRDTARHHRQIRVFIFGRTVRVSTDAVDQKQPE
jgi:hypothetical protein